MPEVVKDEVDKRRDEIKVLGEDITVLNNPDPAKRYRYINKDPKRVARFLAAGYTITKKSEGGASPLIDQPGLNGAQEFGDLVLMETPMENFLARKRRAEAKSAMWERAGIDQARERLNRIRSARGLASDARAPR